MITDAERRTLAALKAAAEQSPFHVCRVPLLLPPRSNARGRFQKHMERYAAQREAGKLSMRRMWLGLTTPRALVIRITREAPRLLDDDNAATACKSFRDGVADALGLNDRDPRLTWLVAQAKAKTAAVLVEVYALRGES